MNNKTRKLKKNKKVKQRGGYVAPLTNPYLIAVAALIGGLYVYGNLFQSGPMAPQPEVQKAGRSKRNRTIKRFRGRRKV
tara:strand:- start:179 stop:415 length:237 start_codon:yes stop_codon:yes gene_type:complete